MIAEFFAFVLEPVEGYVWHFGYHGDERFGVEEVFEPCVEIFVGILGWVVYDD